LNPDVPVTLNVEPGYGGRPSPNDKYKYGLYSTKKTTSLTVAGCKGQDGETTKVTLTWEGKDITLTAQGGKGGGAGSCPPKLGDNKVTGGVGGNVGKVTPDNHQLYVDRCFVIGKKGGDGNFNTGDNEPAKTSIGGQAGIIVKGSRCDDNKQKVYNGTLESFGGGRGARNLGNKGNKKDDEAVEGGGGVGGHEEILGGNGGDGLVTIIYKYYKEE